jgi:formate dehydrogenase major subunit
VLPVAQPSEWQRSYTRFNKVQEDLLKNRETAAAVAK